MVDRAELVSIAVQILFTLPNLRSFLYEEKVNFSSQPFQSVVDRASFKLSFKTVNEADFQQDNRLK